MSDTTGHDRPGKVAPISDGPYRETSWSSVILGVVFGAVLNAAITYSGLKIGFTISGSAIAAVVGFGVLRGLLRRGTILEVNITQTVASGVNIATAGVIFTVPVLFLLDMSFEMGDATFWMLLGAGAAGAALGVVFIIPVRKQMIDIERLRFPSATAVAAILKSPGAGPAKSLVLLAGIVVAMLVYLPAGLPDIKVRARIAELDQLVDQGKITPQAARVTRDIDDWIARRTAPAELVSRGRLIEQYRAEAAARRKAADATPADGDGNGNGEAGERPPTELETQAAEARKGSPHPDELALGVLKATDGEIEWEQLRAKKYGWAARPLWGYADLGIRLRAPRPPPPGADEAALKRHAAAMERVDRDGDGKPDLVVTKNRINAGRWLGLPDQFELIFAIAPFALGAGYLTGRAGLMVLAGGILAFFIINPVAFSRGWMPETITAAQAAEYGFDAFNRPLGIGMLLGGALMGVAAAMPAIRESFRSIAGAGKTGRSSEDMGLKAIVVGAVLATGLLFIITQGMHLANPVAPSGLLAKLPEWARHGIVALVGVGWIWFAGIIIAQCVGMTDWSPVSGMALITVVLVLFLAGKNDVAGAVLIGATLCVAIACASDMMQDLKTGHLVGASPRRQQIVELYSALIGPAISLGTLMLIVGANMASSGVPLGPGTDTSAPQAQALQAVIQGVQGGDMPYALYGLGALLGVLLGIGSFPGLGVLIGLSMYLPFFYILTYGVGCVINMVIGKIKGRVWAEEWGVPFCAGLIVGEALLSLVINAVIMIQA